MENDINEGVDNEHKVGCIGCRFHSKQERRKALGIGDGDLELVEFDDDPQVVLVCRHARQEGREMGLPETSPGADCELFEFGGKRGVSRELEKLLGRWET